MVICLLLCLASVTFGQASTTQIEAIAWSPDGDLIAYSYSSGSPRCGTSETFVYLVDASTQTPVMSLSAGHCAIWSLDWDPTGTYVVGASLDTIGFNVWEAETGQLIATDQIKSQGVIDVQWHPTENQLASTGSGGGLALSNAQTGESVRPLSFSVNATKLDWNQDGSKFAVRSIYESEGHIVDTNSGQTEQVLVGHSTNGGVLDWSPDGTKIVSTSMDNTVRIWNAFNGTLVATYDFPRPGEVEWASDSRRIAVASYDGLVQVRDVSTGEILETFSHPGPVYALSWNPDGQQLAYGGLDLPGAPAQIQIVDAPQIEPTPTPTFTEPFDGAISTPEP
ncbi:MAG: PD40 domain-containing protein [Chloroflexi bacterium]|nr:PD40 domain-containing protein [Chloroflexota bacterium]